MLEFMRSLLFVPGNNPAMVQNAAVFGSDAVILDLEDAVPAGDKPAARAAIAATAEQLAALGQNVAVRINSNWRDAVADLDAAVLATVTALAADLVLPFSHLPMRIG